MERIKQSLSDVVHNWTAIGIITLFLFSVQPGPTITQALEVKPQKTEKQLKREILNKFSNDTYGSSEMLAPEDLKDLLWAVGFEGTALKTAWAVATVESNGRPMALNDNKSTGDKSYGIFQINDSWQGVTNTNFLFDPSINIRMAYNIFKSWGYNFHAWTCGKNLGL